MARLAVLVAALTLLMLFWGGMVTGTASGDATRDWPLHEGKVLPEPSREMVFEQYLHRYTGMAVGMLAFGLSVWTIVRRRRERFFAIAMLAFVAGAGVLGMIRSRGGVAPAVSILHTMVAQGAFALSALLAALLSERPGPVRLVEPHVLPRIWALAAVLFVQSLFGAVYRHTHELLVLHLAGAAAALFVVGWATGPVAREYRDEPRMRRPAIRLMALMTVQLLLGAGSLALVHSGRVKTPDAPVWAAAITALHLAVGALMLAFALILLVRALGAVRAEAPSPLQVPA